MKNILWQISGVIYTTAFIRYFWVTLRSKARPQRVSWLVWAILDTIALRAMYEQGTVNWQIFVACVGAWIVFILLIKFGSKGWTTLDICCLLIGFVGIFLRVILHDPNFALGASLFAMIVAALPTFRSAYKSKDEDVATWVIWSVACFFALIAISKWNFENYAQPVVFAFVEVFTTLILVFNSLIKRRAIR